MSLKNLTGSCWSLLLRLAEANGDSGYAEFVAKWPFSYYQKRIRQTDFVGFDDVLDVGCGNGQWMLALAAENRRVVGIDPHAKRVATANALFEGAWITNAHAQVGSALQLEFENERFDAVFCYGVFMFLDRKAALAEFHRVLKPGGKLYICTNGRGWWLKLALSKVFSNFAMAKVAWLSFLRGRKKGLPNATDLSDMAILDAGQWSDVHAGAEGTVKLEDAGEELKPVYPARFLGYDCVIEFVATKGANIASRQKRGRFPTFLDDRVKEVLAAKSYSFETQLQRYKFEDQPLHPITATNQFAVELALELSSSVDRAEALRHIHEEVTRGLDGERARFVACVEFGKRAFYHHFALQPMIGDKVLLDPIASLLFGACRCGNSARFLIDLLAVNGTPARLLAGGCHTTAEALVDGRWVLADASLFPPGIVPELAGQLLSVDDIVQNPEVLDWWPSFLNYHSGHIAAFKNAYPETFLTIERWLRRPILPSSALFGKEFAGANEPGLLRRWTKNGDAESWNASSDFGWDSLEEVAGAKGPSLDTIQRPGQITQLERAGRHLTWLQPASGSPEDIEYAVHVSRVSRNWSYSAMAADQDFALPGTVFSTKDCELELPEAFSGDRLYVSVVGRIAGRPQAFVLPSNEYYL